MAGKSLQAIGNDALQNAPKPLQRVLHGLNMQFQPENGAVSPLAGGLGPGADGMIAGVQQGRPNTISVMKPDVFTKNADQLATHEGMHVWQNNLPPSLQAKIPADNPNDPNNYGGESRIADLVKHGGTVLDLPREQSAAAMQYGQVHGMPEPYKSLANTMNAIPQSTVDMTDPNAKEINTHPRAPLPPAMNYATQTYGKGDPAPGDVAQQMSAIPKLDPFRNAQTTSAPLNPYSNPEDEPADQALAFNSKWSKPGPYLTKLAPKDESAFQSWAGQNAAAVSGELNNPKADYDVRAHWLAAQHGDPEATLVLNKWDGKMHGNDKFKTPYNGGFSNESQYAKPGAPYWNGDQLVTSNGRLVTDETPKKMSPATDTYKKGQPAPGDDDIDLSAGLSPAPAKAAGASDDIDLSAGLSGGTQSAPDDDRNPIQQRIDDAVNTPSTSGPRALDSFGRGAAQSLLSPLSHPIEAAKGFLKSVQPDPGIAGAAEGIIGGPAGPLGVHALRSLYDDYKQNGASHALGNLAGSFMGGEATGGLLRGAGTAATATGAGIDNAILGTTAGDIERGANPGRALSTNRIWGSNPKSLLSGVKEAVPEASAAHNADISRFTRPGSLINTGPLLSDPFNSAVSEATDPATGAAMPSQISKTRKTQTALTNELDPGTGQPTTSLRNPFLTPLQANKLKSNIYGMTDYDNPSRAAISNTALKGAARNLKGSIEDAVPESIESGQKLHDLMSAKDILTPQALGTKLMPASKSGLIERGTTALGTGTAAGLDAAGNVLKPLGRVSRFINAPLLLPLGSSSNAYAKGNY